MRKKLKNQCDLDPNACASQKTVSKATEHSFTFNVHGQVLLVVNSYLSQGARLDMAHEFKCLHTTFGLSAFRVNPAELLLYAISFCVEILH